MALDCLIFILNFELYYVFTNYYSNRSLFLVKKEPDDTVSLPWGGGKRNKFLGTICILVLFLSILIFLSSFMLVAAT